MEVSFDCTQLCAHAETEEFDLSFCAPEFMASINIIYCCIALCRPAREDVRLLVRTPVRLRFMVYRPHLAPGEIGRLIKLRLLFRIIWQINSSRPDADLFLLFNKCFTNRVGLLL